MTDEELKSYEDKLLELKVSRGKLIRQRKKLLDDLNLYGFNIKYDELGLDKLRTLYYKKEMFSKNQNG